MPITRIWKQRRIFWVWNITNFRETIRIRSKLSWSSKKYWRTSEWKLEMCIRLRMKYKGKLIRSMHRWTKICRCRWPLMKNYKIFKKRLKELNLLIMIVSSQKIMSIRNKIFCFRYDSKHYQSRKEMQISGGI
jgi:hypothetical protein